MAANNPWELAEAVAEVIRGGDPAALEPLMLSADTGAEDVGAELRVPPHARGQLREAIAENLRTGAMHTAREALPLLLRESERRGFDWSEADCHVDSVAVVFEDELWMAEATVVGRRGGKSSRVTVGALRTHRGWHAVSLEAAWCLD